MSDETDRTSVAIIDENGEPRPTHKIAEDFTNQFLNETLGLPMTFFGTRLGLALCDLISKLRGEDNPNDRFSADEEDGYIQPMGYDDYDG